MKRLWAPWRIRYVGVKPQKGCIFCGAAKKKAYPYVLFKTKHSLVILNIYPYNNGHLMVAPLKHIKDISALDDAQTLDLFRSLKKAKELLGKVLKPAGYNIGINDSRVSGAGVDGHMHIHMVPRWEGDTNFMPVVFDTKVVSQSLDELHRLLSDAYAKSNKKDRR